MLLIVTQQDHNIQMGYAMFQSSSHNIAPERNSLLLFYSINECFILEDSGNENREHAFPDDLLVWEMVGNGTEEPTATTGLDNSVHSSRRRVLSLRGAITQIYECNIPCPLPIHCPCRYCDWLVYNSFCLSNYTDGWATITKYDIARNFGSWKKQWQQWYTFHGPKGHEVCRLPEQIGQEMSKGCTRFLTTCNPPVTLPEWLSLLSLSLCSGSP
jgi:hypothetical protein